MLEQRRRTHWIETRLLAAAMILLCIAALAGIAFLGANPHGIGLVSVSIGPLTVVQGIVVFTVATMAVFVRRQETTDTRLAAVEH